MDVSKLEKLACLRIQEQDKEALGKSLDEIMVMLQGITTLDVQKNQENFPNNTVFREQEYQKPNQTGLNVTAEGLFLAPKVIKKD